MSKAALKKELQKLTKEKLVEHILDLYEKNISVKEFYKYYLDPGNEKGLVNKYKKLIRKEFNVENPMWGTQKFSVAKKAISDFKKLHPSAESLADVMLYLPESACELTALYGDYSGPFYNSARNNYKSVLIFMKENDLLYDFKVRAEQCVKWSQYCGYGFAGDMKDTYDEFYN